MPAETSVGVREYVEGLAAGGSWYHAALLAHGREFRGRTRTSAVRDAARWAARAKPRWRQCYKNAAVFVVSHKEAAYYEGFWRYSADDDPVHHAWVMIDGHLLDVTAEDVGRRARRRGITILPPTEQEYFGVHVPTAFVRERADATRFWGPVSEMYLSAFDADTFTTDLATGRV